MGKILEHLDAQRITRGPKSARVLEHLLERGSASTCLLKPSLMLDPRNAFNVAQHRVWRV